MSGLTLPALLERHLAARPDEVAFVAGDRWITYAEFDVLGRKTAAWLTAQGIGRGDRVAVWLVNRIEWLAALFGLARIGAALVSVNTRYRASELAHLLERSGARMLVLQLSFRKIDFPAVLEAVDPASVPALERAAVVDPGGGLPEPVLGRATVAFDAFASPAAAGADRAEPDGLAILFATSGTTKGPKLVMHSQRTLAYHSECVARAYGFAEPGARLLAAVPFCGVYGLNGTLAAFAAGAPVVLMETFDGTPAATLVRKHAITHMFGSDEMYRRMMEAVPGHDPFPSARVFGYAAFQPGGAEFARAAWARRVPLVGLYGSSEVQALFSLQPLASPLDERIEGGGRPASPEAAVRIRDVDSGALAPVGQSGEIEIRAPSNFAGYLDNPEATANAVRADGFFRTGDIGHLRPDGTFVYETRSGDAIRLAGFLVNPAEIEDTLKGIPGIGDVTVIAVEMAGQTRCVAFVVPAAGGPPEEAAVIAAAGQRMAGFKIPARVWFVDELPTTMSANGTKVQRARLREMALERLAARRDA